MKGLVLYAWPLVATGLVSCVALLLLRCGVALLLCGAAVLCRACGVASLLQCRAAVLRRAGRGEVGHRPCFSSTVSEWVQGPAGLRCPTGGRWHQGSWGGVAVTLALFVWFLVLLVALGRE